MNSILQYERECYVCKTTLDLHKHHIFYGVGRRQISEREGCFCYLCARHHNMSNAGVHFNHELDMRLKQECEQAWLNINDKDIEDFIKVFGRNYI